MRRAGRIGGGLVVVGGGVAVAGAVIFAAWLLAGRLGTAPGASSQLGAAFDAAPAGVALAAVIWGGLAVALVGASTGPRAAEPGRVVRAETGACVGAPRSPMPSAMAWIPMVLGFAGVVGTYHGLLGPGAISWGDWGYYVNPSAVRAFFPVPSVWAFSSLGSANVLGTPLFPVLSAIGGLARLGVPYAVLERAFFYYPAVVLGYWGPVAVLRRLGVGAAWAAVGGVLYAVNPYALILVSGGQLTVGVGYALLPWVALTWLRAWERCTLVRAVVAGALLGVQAWFDPRTAGLSVAALLVAGVLLVPTHLHRDRLGHLVRRSLVPAGVTFLVLQGPWLLPALLTQRPALPAGYTTAAALQTFSFMSLGDGLTVFHPFWPRMIFVVLFGVPALWLVIPAGLAVATVRRSASTAMRVCLGVYLVFAALVSGANPPFGALNAWLFVHVPGMDLFRDPSPYFGPAALAVALGIPIGFGGLARATPGSAGVTASRASVRGWPDRLGRLVSGTGMSASFLALLVALGATSAWPALSGSLRHNLSPRRVPAAYSKVGRLLGRESSGGVLWIPSTSRFAPLSRAHPDISAIALEQLAGVDFPATVGPLAWLDNPGLVGEVIARYGIGAVVLRRNPGVYRTLSVPYRSTLRATRVALAGDPAWNLGSLTVFRVGTGHTATVTAVPVSAALVAEGRVDPGELPGYPLTVGAAPGGGLRAQTALAAFPSVVGQAAGPAPRTPPAGTTLELVTPRTQLALLQARLAEGRLQLRVVATGAVAASRVGSRGGAARTASDWGATPLAGEALRRGGALLSVGALDWLVAPGELAGSRVATLGAVSGSGRAVRISVAGLGPNEVGDSSSGGTRAAGWGPVGNVNDYNHLSVRAAGISATADGACGRGALTLTAARDAAGISARVRRGRPGLVAVGGQLERRQGEIPQLSAFRGGPSAAAVLTGPVLRGRPGESWTTLTGPVTAVELSVEAARGATSVACLRQPFVRAVDPMSIVTLPLPAGSPVSDHLAPRPRGRSRAPTPAVALAGVARELDTPSFSAGLGAWGPVGNGNNYDHLTLAAAGVSGRVVRSGDHAWLRLAATYGAAAVSQPFTPWSGIAEQTIRIRYRTAGPAALEALVFWSGQPSPVAQVGLAPTSDRWRSVAESFAIVPSLLAAPSGSTAPPGSYQLELGLSPAAVARPVLADVSAVSLMARVVNPIAIAVPDRLLRADRLGSISAAVSAWSADTVVARVHPTAASGLLVLWQRFAPGWRATGAGGRRLVHVVVNGWANGFVLPPSAVSRRYTLTYGPEAAVVFGFAMLAAGLGLALVLVTSSLWVQRRRARRRRQGVTS